MKVRERFNGLNSMLGFEFLLKSIHEVYHKIFKFEEVFMREWAIQQSKTMDSFSIINPNPLQLIVKLNLLNSISLRP
jgi:hypothetical protein